MKKYIYLILILAALYHSSAYSQIAPDQNYINQTKYWFYRNRLTNEFCKVGPEKGESCPVMSINFRSDYEDPITHVVKPGNYMETGDGSLQKIGQYLAVLATEYKLLQMNLQNTDNTAKELYYALNAIKRLDESAETYNFCYSIPLLNDEPGAVFDYPPYTTCDGAANTNLAANLNGFLIRTDLDPRNGIDAGRNGGTPPASNILSHFNNMIGATHIASSFGGNIKDYERRGFLVPPNRCVSTPVPEMVANDASHDQINHLLIGFRLVQTFVGDNLIVDPDGAGTLPARNIKQFSAELATRLLNYMANGTVMNSSNQEVINAYLKNYVSPIKLDNSPDSKEDVRNIFLSLYLGNTTVGQAANPIISPFFKPGTHQIPWLSMNPVLNQPAALSVDPGGAFPFALSYGYAKAAKIFTGQDHYYHPAAKEFWLNLYKGIPQQTHTFNDAIKVLSLVAISNSWDFPCTSVPCYINICIKPPISNTCVKTIKIPMPSGPHCVLAEPCTGSGREEFLTQTKLAKQEILPLINNVIYGGTDFGSHTAYFENFFMNAINNAPCRGPYCYTPQDLASGGWASFNMFVENDERYSGAYDENGNAHYANDMGEYNGLDYMMLYNLYNIYKSNSNSYIPNYADNLTIPSKTISGKSEYYNARSYRNANGSYNYQNGNINVSNLTVNNNGYVNFRAGSSVVFSEGFIVEPGSKMEASIYQPTKNWDWEMNICGMVSGLLDPDNDGIPNGHRMAKSSDPVDLISEVGITGLGQCYPNPTDNSTFIPYEVAEETKVEISVSDIFGKTIAVLISKEKHECGKFKLDFNTSSLKPGIYYYTMKTKKYTETKKLMIIK